MRNMWVFLSLIVACGGTAATTSTSAVDSSVTVSTAATTAPTTTTTTEPTTTTLSQAELDQLQYEADVDLIKDLWRAQSDAWSLGVEAGYAHAAENDYPALECTVDDMSAHYDYDERTEQEMVVHAETVERDDGWVSPGLGAVPDGRIYIYQITHTFSQPGFPPSSSLSEVHTTVVGDRAYFFISCR